jgi:phage shock protein A
MANRRRLSLTLDSRLNEKLAAEATRRRQSLPETIRGILTEYFQQQEENEESQARYDALLEEAGRELDAMFEDFWNEWKERKRRG